MRATTLARRAARRRPRRRMARSAPIASVAAQLLRDVLGADRDDDDLADACSRRPRRSRSAAARSRPRTRRTGSASSSRRLRSSAFPLNLTFCSGSGTRLTVTRIFTQRLLSGCSGSGPGLEARRTDCARLRRARHREGSNTVQRGCQLHSRRAHASALPRGARWSIRSACTIGPRRSSSSRPAVRACGRGSGRAVAFT